MRKKSLLILIFFLFMGCWAEHAMVIKMAGETYICKEVGYSIEYDIIFNDTTIFTCEPRSKSYRVPLIPKVDMRDNYHCKN